MSPLTQPRHLRFLPGVVVLIFFVMALAVSAQGGLQGRSKPAESIPRPGTIVVRDVDGTDQLPLADRGQKATVLFFLMHDCPVANSYAPEINRIVAQYEALEIRCAVVYVETDLTLEKARRHAAEFGFKCTVLWDQDHRLVEAIHATVSPEAALVSPSGELLYRGRIDDRVAGIGKRRVEPTRRDLRLALDAFLGNKTIATRLTRAIGCYIPDRLPTESTRKSKLP